MRSVVEESVERTSKTRWCTKTGVTLTSVALGAFGTLLLFAPAEVSEALTSTAGDNVLVQVCAAAVLGFAIMNWTARGMALGGIYGRAVVAGNHSTGVYVCGAALFSFLLFFSSGLRKP